MNEQNEKLTELQSIIETAVSYHNDRLFSSFDSLLSNVILPAWRTVLLELCGTIEQFHLVAAGDGDSKHEPDFIVHYTSVATLVSMLQGQVDRNKHQANGGDTTSTPEEGQRFKGGQRSSLRLYDSAHFNDPGEGNYLARYLSHDSEGEWLQQSTATHAYIASFIIPNDGPIEAWDDLVFWRTYGKEGAGCSLKLWTPPSQVLQVLYKKDEMERTKSILAPALNAIYPLVNLEDHRTTQELRENFWQSMGKILFLYKNPAYEYERECRLVVPATEVNDHDIAFDYVDHGDASGHLRHFYEVEALDITRILSSGSTITIGPCVTNKQDLLQSLEMLKRKANLRGPAIKPSGITYRRV